MPPPPPQNTRGGRVRLASIMMPEMEFNHSGKVGALFRLFVSMGGGVMDGWIDISMDRWIDGSIDRLID